MTPKQIKLILAVLAALGVGGGTLLTGGKDGPKSVGGGAQLDDGKVAGLGVGASNNAASVTAAINCRFLEHWTSDGGGPRINQAHVFCGEWDDRRSRAKGFHSRPGGRNPGTVGGLDVSQPPNRDGIYGVRWRFAGKRGDDKFSTMFPDHCTRESVLASIAYAAQNKQNCPSGAPRWAWCGPSASSGSGQGLCTGKGGGGFIIAGGSLDDGRINTAFPLR